MDVVQEGEVVIGERVLVVQEDALFEVLDGMLIVAHFEVCETEVVVQLGVVFEDTLSILERSNCGHILPHLVHCDTVVEKGLPGGRVLLFEMLLAHDRKTVPVLRVEHILADLLER